MRISILHTNDLHGMLTAEKMPFLLERRQSCNLYFDTGDSIRTGNLGLALRPDPVWDRLRVARCSASVIGNRETHIIESAFRAKLAGATHPVLCGNLRTRSGERPLPGVTTLETGGVKLGVVGVSVAMVTQRMKTQAASSYLWDNPVSTAAELAREVRPHVDVLVGLTHIGLAQDRQLAEDNVGFDVIFGGHSHSVLQEPMRIGNTWICQGGSHARFLGVYQWVDGKMTGGLEPWPKAP